MEWVEKKSSELYVSSSGLSKSSDLFGYGYPFLSYKDVFNNYYAPDKLSTLVNSTEKDRMKCSVKQGDVFLTRTSETTDELGMSCVALHDYVNATFNGFTKRLRPLTDEIEPKYAAYYFRSPYFRSQCISLASLITRASLNDGMIRRLKIRYPLNRKVQEKIGEILYTYDTLIENNTKRIRLLEKMAENLYKEWFVRFRFPGHENVEMENGLPKGWKVEKLGEWGIELETGKRPKGGIDGSIKDGCPSLGAECIKELASFDYSSVKMVPKDFYDSLKRGKSSGNDILLYKDGAYIGKVTMFRDSFPYSEYSINEHVFFLSPMNVKYRNYLYFTLHQKEFFALMQNLNRNAAQPGLSRSDVERVKIVVPPSKIVEFFDLQVERMLKVIFSLAKQNSLLARQRDLLLPRLMSGKLEVKEELLE